MNNLDSSKLPTPPEIPRKYAACGVSRNNRLLVEHKTMSTTQYRPYFPKRLVPVGHNALGTYYSNTSEFYDLYSIKNYYNWQYKLCPRLPCDNRPIWK